jgi:hypothetical protein
MREYTKVSPQLWIGKTGKELRGDLVTQVTRDYLLTGPSAHGLGMYYLPIPTASHETGIPSKGLAKALARLSELEFCLYDLPTEWIFIMNMARFQFGDRIEPLDNRVKWIKSQLESLRISPFFDHFLDLYRTRFHLQDVEPSGRASVVLVKDKSLSLSQIDQSQSLILDPDPEKPSTDQAELLARLWNEVAPDLSPARLPLGKEVRGHARTRLKELPLESWRPIFERANRSPFLRGEVKKWHVTFSWAMEQSDFAEKVLEGRWDASTKFPNGNGSAPLPLTVEERLDLRQRSATS